MNSVRKRRIVRLGSVSRDTKAINKVGVPELMDPTLSEFGG